MGLLGKDCLVSPVNKIVSGLGVTQKPCGID